MIQEGLKLTLLGMGVVFAFLGLLVVVIKLLAKVLQPLTDREEASRQMLPHKPRSPRQQQETEDRRRVMAVISAAIAAHRSQEAALPGAHTSQAAAGPLASESQQRRRSRQSSTPVARRPPSLARMFFRERTAFQVFLRK